MQLTYHINYTQAQIDTLQVCCKARRSNLPSLFTTEFGSLGIQRGGERDEVRKLELAERIERMRAQDGKRQRFDGEKYRKLAETALAELQ